MIKLYLGHADLEKNISDLGEDNGTAECMYRGRRNELADTYCSYLKDSYNVRPFYSAEAAISAFKNEYFPDLIITDIKMPNISGIELIDHVRRIGKKNAPPVILISGYADKSNALMAIEKEVFGFLEKPFELEQLRNLIEKANHRLLSEELKLQLLEKYKELSSSNLGLLAHYRERFQKAENLLYDSNISMQKDLREASLFLSTLGEENNLEKKNRGVGKGNQ